MKFSVLSFLVHGAIIMASGASAQKAVFTESLTDSSSVDTTAEVSYELEPVVVTATRIPHSLWETPGDVTVIDADELDFSSARDLGEALRLVPGVAVGLYGSQGQNISLGLRGSTAEQVLIMVDGRRVNDPQLGGLDLNVISIENVERIEVVRGGASALYGANAVGGVVNIIPRSFSYARPYSNIVVERGDYGYKKSGIRFGRSVGSKTTIFLVGEFLRSGGHRVNSDFEGNKVNGRVKVSLERGGEMTLLFGKYRGRLGVPGAVEFPSPRARRDDDRWDLSLSMSRSDGSRDDTEAMMYYTDSRQDYKDPDWRISSTHDVCTYGGQFHRSFPLFDRHRILVGGEVETQNFDSSDLGNRRVGWGAVFGQDEVRLTAKTTANLMGRFDYYTTHGSQISHGVILSHRLGERALLFSSLRRSFRAPTANELYWNDPGWGSYGNPDLRPERGISFEIGSRTALGEFAAISATMFHRRMTDLIQWETDLLTWETHVVNRRKTRFTGLDSQLECDLGHRLALTVSTSLLRAKDQDADKSLPYSPGVRLGGSIQYEDDFLHDEIGLMIRIEGEYLGERFVDFVESEKLSAETLVKGKVSVRFLDLRAYVMGENLLDRTYELRKGYPMPGRIYRWGASWKFWD